MTDILLQTKICLPRVRPSLVPRPRLIEKLNAGLDLGFMLVSAPAGFGKTTLLASWLASSGASVAWLSLDKDDNQDGRFLHYLIAALQKVDQSIGQQVAQLLKNSQQRPFDLIFTSLVNDLQAAKREIYLVLDDYHFISSQTIHDAVAFLLDHSPGMFHLVLASRSDPPLPLARLRARGQIVELRAADLRFSESEAAHFFNDMMGLSLDALSMAKLAGRSEGWVAGLQMAALSLANREDVSGFIEGFSGTNRYIMDYLLEEVLAKQPPEIQHFLLSTSILDRLTAPLCEAILANDGEFGLGIEPKQYTAALLSPRNAASILNYLERENLFLVPLDDERIWFRYHHLFADLLRARLHQAEPDSIPSLHRLASAWWEENGYIPEAVTHLLAAAEPDQAAGLIEHYGPAYLADNDPSVLQMADRLPPDELLARPKIALHQAWHLIILGRIKESLPLLQDLARELAGTHPKSEKKWMQTIITLALAFLDPPENKSNSAPLPDYHLLDQIPSEELILRNAADFLYGMTLGRRGDLDRAVMVSLKSIRREKRLPGAQMIPTLAPFLTRIYLIQGRLHKAASLCREILDPIKERDIRFIYTAGSMKIDLGEVLYEWNFLEEAEQHIQAGLDANEAWKNIMTDGFGLIALTRVLQAKGDYIEALQAAADFESRMREHSRPREFDEAFRTLSVRVRLASGDQEFSARWAEQIQLSEDYALHKAYYRLTLAHISLSQGRYAAVENLLDGAMPPPGIGSQISRKLECNLLLAAAVAGQNRLSEALDLIESCLAIAESEGYIRVFLDVGEPARALLAAYLRSAVPVHNRFAQKVLDAFGALGETEVPKAQPSGLIELLSDRELEVLKIIAQGKTNKEIAGELIIAPGTVKAHTASIYRKLDVANRTEAVARARDIGLLP